MSEHFEKENTMEAMYEDVKIKIQEITEQFGVSFVLSSRLGHHGTCELEPAVQKEVEEAIRKCDDELLKSARLLRTIVTNLVAGKGKKKYRPGNEPEWWLQTGIPFICPWKGCRSIIVLSLRMFLDMRIVLMSYL
ncbi:uncharacterized protein LOC132755961 [Ruditapes philippinarum]|uniref:uncharacterized protein LOC132755961 n=1 Tax=Ruditapes philippinarum TaxID=129788 RepID=UPI00295B60DC|nr:uncharacterized protein LOC132755961 [Ruditapes philippinarum]